MADQNLAEKIARQLRRDILRGVLEPGAPVKERETASEMGVSRTPMREAIRMLAKEGLIWLRPARSPVVANPGLDEVRDAIEVLSALEMLSIRLACLHATDADIKAIRSIEQSMAENFDTLEDIERFEIDMEFHIAIVKASHNATLAETHLSYLERLWRARFLSARRKNSKERVLRQHDAIIDALEKRNLSAATEALHAHLEHLFINIEHVFATQGEPAQGEEQASMTARQLVN